MRKSSAVVIAARVDAAVADRLAAEARARGITVSDLVREAVEHEVGAPSSAVTKAADEAAEHLAELTGRLADAAARTAATVRHVDRLRAASFGFGVGSASANNQHRSRGNEL